MIEEIQWSRLSYFDYFITSKMISDLVVIFQKKKRATVHILRTKIISFSPEIVKFAHFSEVLEKEGEGFQDTILDIKLRHTIFIHQGRQDCKGRTSFCNSSNCDSRTDTILTFLHLKIVQQCCEHILRSNGFSNIPKCVHCCSADTFLVRFKHLKKLKTNSHPLPCRKIQHHDLQFDQQGQYNSLDFLMTFLQNRGQPRKQILNWRSHFTHTNNIHNSLESPHTTNLRKVWLNSLAKGIYNNTKSVKHHIDIVIGLLLEGIKDIINEQF
ncbi:hypothetical protein H5410_019296 [Solanum commersonii]|uniref:Uncharacterized protein n=1 Tax=Solanum commersonii TaxID=4109 RepID=A0A9J6A519_SOLCO|nr:hypothetical protein H5410_019296 [Solanum commersonii]